MNKITTEMAKQVNAKELHFAKFQLISDDAKNGIIVGKGKRFFRIYYNKGADLYDATAGKLKGYTEEVIEKDLKGVYGDQLRGLIQDHFPRFEYVMDSIKIRGVNC